MSLTPWQPLRQIEDFFGRYGNLFNKPIGRLSNMEAVDNHENAWLPTADITESETEYTIKAELPEVKKDDVEVSIQDGVICISGERKYKRKEKNEKLHRIESYYGRFQRSFSLPENVDSEKISAQTADGVLTVHLPKAKSAKSKSIEVNVS